MSPCGNDLTVAGEAVMLSSDLWVCRAATTDRTVRQTSAFRKRTKFRFWRVAHRVPIWLKCAVCFRCVPLMQMRLVTG